MNDDSLDDLLKKFAAEARPPVPGNLEGRVWREIRARQGERESRASRWWLRAWQRWHEPRLALASVAAAMAVGIGMGWRTLPGGGSTTSAAARGALDLSVFSARPPALPSTLLARAHHE